MKDNSTGKNSDFYALGKKMFDRLNPIPQDVTQIPQEDSSKREWVGLTDEEMQAIWDRYAHMEMMRAIEAKLKELNT